MEHQVFISYAREDRSTAEAVCSALEKAGLPCWVDFRDIVPGKRWSDAIVEAITSSRVMVLIFSAHASLSRDVIREMDIASEQGVEIIPLKIDGSCLDGSFKYYLSATQWLDAASASLEEAVVKLAESVRMVLREGDNKPDRPLNRDGRARHASLESALSQAIESAPLKPNNNFGYMHLVARPASTTSDLFTLNPKGNERSSIIQDAAKAASGSCIFSRNFSPAFSVGSVRPTTKGWVVYMGYPPDEMGNRPERYTLDLSVDFDGDIHLFCGRIAERRDSILQTFDMGIAETTVRFLTVAGLLYEEAGYRGACDLAVAITGVMNAESHTALIRFGLCDGRRFLESSYRRTIQAHSSDLVKDARGVARNLLARFFHVTLGDNIDLFSTPAP